MKYFVALFIFIYTVFTLFIGFIPLFIYFKLSYTKEVYLAFIYVQTINKI